MDIKYFSFLQKHKLLSKPKLENNGAWTAVCKDCRSKHGINLAILTPNANEYMCYFMDCTNDADYIVSLGDDD